MANSSQRKHIRQAVRDVVNEEFPQLASLAQGDRGLPPNPEQSGSAHAAKESARSKQGRKGYLSRFLRIVGKILAFAVTTLGLITGVLSLYQRLEVSPAEPINTSKPLTVPFVVINGGPFKIVDASFRCYLRNFRYARNSGIGDVIADWNATTPTMEVGEKTTGQCFQAVAIAAAFTSGELQIDIGYRTQYFPIHQLRQFRFISWTDNDGKLQWRPKAIGEPDFVQEE